MNADANGKMTHDPSGDLDGCAGMLYGLLMTPAVLIVCVLLVLVLRWVVK